jgi:F-type H+-transporting ATPase subunit epsilon
MSLELEILVPDGVVVREEVAAVRAADASGSFGLLPNHQAFLTLLVPCVLSFRTPGGAERYAAADGGVLLLEDGRVQVVTRDAVVADSLTEVADAAERMLEARRSAEHAARAEFAELQSSLLRELRKMEQRK